MQFRPPPPPVAPAVACGCDTVWSVSAGRSATGEVHVVGPRLVLAGTDRTIYVLDADSGAQIWRRRLSGALLAGVTVRDGAIYASSDRPQGETLALDLETGRLRWRARVGRSGLPVLVTGDRAVIRTRGGAVVALALGSGVEAWRRQVGGTVTPLAATATGAILATGADTLYLLDAGSGAVLHRAPAPGELPGGWVAAGGTLVGALASGPVVALDGATLAERWRHTLDGGAVVPPRLEGDSLIVVTQVGTIWSVPVTGARPRALHRTGRPITAGAVPWRGRLLVPGADGSLRALAPGGREEWRVNQWAPLRIPPATLPGGDLVVLGSNGDLIRYRFP